MAAAPPAPLREVGRGSRELARAQGIFNIIGGAWPIASLRSFEKIFGPKSDDWLEYTVGGLLVAIGTAQLADAAAPAGPAAARRLGIGTALTLLTIDLIYVPRGRIRWTYLLDAAMETGWLVAWSTARRDG